MKTYENKIEEHRKAYEKIEEHMEAYETKIKELLEMGQKSADRIVSLETQNQRLMEMVKNSANEQVKMTQTWAQVVASAPASGNTSPTTPSSQPSLPRSSVNPSSSASQPSHLSQNAILIDLSRTDAHVSDIMQLKAKVNDALAQHDATKEVVCTGVQRRAGGEDRVKLSFPSPEMAKKARQHDQWLHEGRFGPARMLGEQWYPIKVDRVHRATLSPDGSVTVSQAATETVAEENGIQIERIRWLGKSFRQDVRIGGHVPDPPARGRGVVDERHHGRGRGNGIHQTLRKTPNPHEMLQVSPVRSPRSTVQVSQCGVWEMRSHWPRRTGVHIQHRAVRSLSRTTRSHRSSLSKVHGTPSPIQSCRTPWLGHSRCSRQIWVSDRSYNTA